MAPYGHNFRGACGRSDPCSLNDVEHLPLHSIHPVRHEL